MNRNAWPGSLAIAAAIGLWGASWWTQSVVLRVMLSAVAIVGLVLLVIYYRRTDANTRSCRNQKSATNKEQDLKEAILQAISMRRHDYMNDIQLLMGYLQLKKYDKLKGFVEILRDKAMQESHMFRWGDPDLIIHMYTFGASSRKLQVTIETDEDVQLHKLSADREYVSARIIQMTGIFEQIAVSEAVQTLSIAVYIDQHHLCTVYEYEGGYEEQVLHRSMNSFLDEQDRQLGTSLHWEGNEDWVTVTLRFPLEIVNAQAVQ